MGEAERDRIGIGRKREFVDEELDREHVGVGAERAQRRHPDRHRLDEVMHHALARKLVERDGVAVAAARRLRQDVRRRRLLRLGEIPARQQIVAAGLARPRRVGVGPDVVVPIGDAAVGSERSLGLHHHGGAERLPAELVAAHPLHPHRPAAGRGAREQRRVERDVVGAVVAVAAGAFGVDAVDLRPPAASAPCEVAAQREHALAVVPDGHLAVLELRRPRRTDRSRHGPCRACGRSPR